MHGWDKGVVKDGAEWVHAWMRHGQGWDGLGACVDEGVGKCSGFALNLTQAGRAGIPAHGIAANQPKVLSTLVLKINVEIQMTEITHSLIFVAHAFKSNPLLPLGFFKLPPNFFGRNRD